MPNRTTVERVQVILGKNWDDRTDVTPYIDTANAIVNRVAVCAVSKGRTLTSTELELIERWLSAHYYFIMDQLFSSKRAEGAMGVFQGKTDMYLESTTYGQTAIRLDSSGCLQAIGGKEWKVASGFWLGRDPVDQTRYCEGVGRGFDSTEE